MRLIKINYENNPVILAKVTLVVVVSEHVARGAQRLSLGTERAQVLTSEEQPNGKANTVITKALLRGAACSENSVCLCLHCHVQDVMLGTLFQILQAEDLRINMGNLYKDCKC